MRERGRAGIVFIAILVFCGGFLLGAGGRLTYVSIERSTELLIGAALALAGLVFYVALRVRTYRRLVERSPMARTWAEWQAAAPQPAAAGNRAPRAAAPLTPSKDESEPPLPPAS